MADQEKSFQVKIVTPDGEVYSHRAVSVSMRATDGERSVLYNHLPILTTLTIGEVRVTRSREMDNQVDHIALAGGYFEFSNNVATIIADSAERSKNIDVDRAKSARDRAKKALEKAKQQHDKMSLERAQTELKRAVNRISVFNSKK